MPSVIRGDDNFDSGAVLGQGQTWQNVAASRSAGVTYTNNTGKPIYITVTSSATDGFIYIYVDNIIVVQSYEGSGTDVAMSCIIPAGSTYKFSSNFYNWFELR